MSSSRIGSLIAGVIAVVTTITPAAAGSPIRIDVVPFPAPPRAGTVELRIVPETDARPWRGVIGVAGRAAHVEIAVDLPAHGRRILTVPFRIAPGERAVDVSANGESVARVDVPAAEADPARILVVDDGTRAAPDSVALTAGRLSLPLERLPETAAALDAFDLVILPRDGAVGLRPGQEAALERWVRTGGVVGSTGDAAAVVRELGRGATIVGGDVAAIERAHRQWRRDAPDDGGRSALAAWDGSTRPAADAGAWNPAIDPRLVLLVYVALLVVLGGLCARSRRARPVALPAVALLVLGGSLAVWTGARAATTSDVEVEESSFALAPADGSAPRVDAIVTLVARRAGTIGFVPRLADPAVWEAPAPALPGVRRHPVRLGADGRRWERTLALGERATVRAGGVGPALGIHVRAEGPGTWVVENNGDRRLRSPAVLGHDRLLRAGEDLLPGARWRADLGTADALRTPDLAPWARRLVPRAPVSPLLVAVVEPAVSSLDFPDSRIQMKRTMHLALPLPLGTVAR